MGADLGLRRPPLALRKMGRVMDGMHRVVRALRTSDYQSEQFEGDPEPDYRNRRPRDLPY